MSYYVIRKKQEVYSDLETEGVVPEDITKRILRVARDQLAEDELDNIESDNYSEAESAGEDGEYIEADDADIAEEDVQMEFSRKNVKFDQQSEVGDSGVMHNGTDLPAEVIDHYTRIGKFLSVYTVGKIPKGFKLLPTRKAWEELLYFTNPVEWTPHAHFQATRIFASNLNDNLAQRYFNLVLLPAIRADIKANKKLHFQLYQALKKAMFKPLAFMKGILIPLSDASDCTLREVVIVGSVLAKMTVPMAFGAAALFKLAVSASKWTPVKSVLVSMLVNKKYSLPTQVVEGLVVHFTSFLTEYVDHAKLPVLWHGSLLAFVQRYKHALSDDQKKRLLAILPVHSHHQITPEIRRELTTLESAMTD